MEMESNNKTTEVGWIIKSGPEALNLSSGTHHHTAVSEDVKAVQLLNIQKL